MARRRLVLEERPDRSNLVRFKHRLLVDALMLSMSLEKRHESGFLGRLRHLTNRMFPRPVTEAKRGPDMLYSLRDALDVALALQLQRGFVGEHTSVQIVKNNAELLGELWERSLIKMDTFTVQIAVDAFEPNGNRNTDAPAVFATTELRVALRGEDIGARPLVTIGASEVATGLVDALVSLGLTPADLEDAKEELTRRDGE